MAKGFQWDFSDENIILEDEKVGFKLQLIKNGGIVVHVGNIWFEVDPDDIKFVFFQPPKLFKAGSVALFDRDDGVLYYDVEGFNNPLPLIFDVKRKQKSVLNTLLSVFKGNGFDCKIG